MIKLKPTRFARRTRHAGLQQYTAIKLRRRLMLQFGPRRARLIAVTTWRTADAILAKCATSELPQLSNKTQLQIIPLSRVTVVDIGEIFYCDRAAMLREVYCQDRSNPDGLVTLTVGRWHRR